MALQFETHPERMLHVLAFKDVTNSGELHKLIVSAEMKPDAAFINAKLVPSSAILHAAGSRALIAQSREKLVTRSLHAELVYNLSGSKHITEALRRWGVTADVTAVLVAVFDASAADVQTLRGLVQGVEVGTAGSIEDAMGGLVDLVATKKAYKIQPAELEVGTLTDAILTRMAVRDC